MFAALALFTLQVTPMTAKFSDMRLYSFDGLTVPCWADKPIFRSEEENHESGIVTVTKKYLVPAPENGEPFLWIIFTDRQDTLNDSYVKLGASDAFKDFVKPDEVKIISTFGDEALAKTPLGDVLSEFGARNLSLSFIRLGEVPVGKPTKDPFLNEILPYAPEGTFTGYILTLKKGGKTWQIMTPMASIYGSGSEEKLAKAQQAFDANWKLMLTRCTAGQRRKQLEADFQIGGPFKKV